MSSQFKQIQKGKADLPKRTPKPPPTTNPSTTPLPLSSIEPFTPFLLPKSITPSESDKEKKFQSQAKWALDKYKKTDKYYCRVTPDCTKSYKLTSRPSNLIPHLQKSHKLVIPLYLLDLREEPVENQKSIVQSFSVRSHQQRTQKRSVALAYAMNPTVPLKTIDDKFWQIAFGPLLQDLNRKTLKVEILLLSEEIRLVFFDKIRNSIVSVSIDGGTTVSNQKVISICISLQHKSYFFDLTDTELSTCDGLFYKKLWIDTIMLLTEKLNCFVVSANLDNEAASRTWAGLGNPR
jgi:hypothetical protein